MSFIHVIKTKTFLRIFVFQFLVIITFPTSISAKFFGFDVRPDTETGSYGVSSYLFDNIEDDPSAQQFLDASNPVFRDFIDNSTVLKTTLVHKPEIISGINNLEKINGRYARGVYIFDISGEIPNLALKNNVLENNEVPPDVYMNTTIAGRQGNPFHALCEYDGLNQEDCAQKYHLNLSSGDINPNQAVTPLQRLLPPEEYYKYIKNLAKEHSDCISGNVDNINCSAKYFLDKNGEIKSEDVAEYITSTEYGSFKNASPTQKQQAYALNTSHALVPIVIYIDRVPNWENENTNPFNLIFSYLQEFLDGESVNYPIYGMGWLPKTYSSKVQGEYSLLAGLPPEEGQKHLENKQKETFNPIDWNKIGSSKDIKLAFAEKVIEQSHGSLDKETVFQNTGGYTKSRANPLSKNEVRFQVNDILNNKNENIFTYTIALITPPEIVNLEMDMNQIASSLVPPEYLDFPESNIQFPLEKKSETITVKENDEDKLCTKYVDGECVKYDEVVEIRWPESKKINGRAEDGITNLWISTGTMGLLSYNDPSRAKTMCHGQEYFQNNPTAKQTIEAVGVFDLFDTTSCPEQLKEKNSSNIGYGACKQHLFEKSCDGQTCYKYIIEAANKAICKESGPNYGKHLNPYYAIAIALNENGGLVSDRIDASQKDHFGCDPKELIYETDILSKMSCMIKTLLAHCGKSDTKNLKNYGYDATYKIGPLITLGRSRQTPLFVNTANTEDLLFNLLDVDWQEYYPNEPIESCEKTDSYSI